MSHHTCQALLHVLPKGASSLYACHVDWLTYIVIIIIIITIIIITLTG